MRVLVYACLHTGFPVKEMVSLLDIEGRRRSNDTVAFLDTKDQVPVVALEALVRRRVLHEQLQHTADFTSLPTNG